MGYTPQLAVGVWTGNADSKAMKLADGSITAAPIFSKILAKGVDGLPAQGWTEPAGISKVRVCVPSGLLPTADCPSSAVGLFLRGKEPKQQDNIYQAFEINGTNGKRASACTPPDQLQRVTYQVFGPNAADWVRDQGIAQPPVEVDGPCGGGELAGDVQIGSPFIGARVKGGVQITGNARAGDFRAYRVEVGSGGEWTPVGGEHGEQISNGPLEFWDTTGFAGMYTLRLVVMENSGNILTYEMPVVVDNNAPKVEIVHPAVDQIYVMETDELVSITADAQDDWEMDRVEFYLDGAKLGETTVAPYSVRWTIKMTDVVPKSGPTVYATKVITNPDGTVTTEQVIDRETKTEKYKKPDGTTAQRVVIMTGGGAGATVMDGKLHEIHTIWVKAFDKAGNEVKSSPVRIFVKHKDKEPTTP